MSQRAAKVVGGVAVLLATGWAGGGVWAGHRVETELQALQNAPHAAGSSVHLSGLRHQRGLFSASGEADVTVMPGCDAAAGQDEPMTMRLDYQVSHLPLPGSLARFAWQLSPTGETGMAFRQVFGTATSLSGTGAMSLAGALRTDMRLPALSMQRAGSALQLAPSAGFLTLQDKALAFGWQLPRVVMRGDGQALELNDTRIDLDLRNRYLGTGTTGLRVGLLSAGFGTLEGLAIESNAVEDGDRLHLSVMPSIARLQAGGQTLEGLALELVMKGMDTRSVETLTTVFSASCGMDSLTADEARRTRDAVVTLLTRGFSAGIGKLSGHSAEGALEGHMMVELLPSTTGSISLLMQLRSSGQLALSGRLLTEAHQQLALQTNMAVAQGNGLQARYDYAEGQLKLNGREVDAGGLLRWLVNTDADLAEQIARWGPQTQPRAVPRPPEVTPVAVPPAEPIEPAAAPAVEAAAPR